MGHYASEMRGDAEQREIDTRDAERRQWQKAGYTMTLLPTCGEWLECPKCAAVVSLEKWKKHATYHKMQDR